KALLEKDFSELLFRDEKDIQLKEAVIEIPHTALPYFHQETVHKSADKSNDSWMYEPFSVEYRESEGSLVSVGTGLFSSIVGCISRKTSDSKEWLVFLNTDVRDMTVRAASISADHRSHLFEATYDYERLGYPDTSRGVLSYVLENLNDYVIWKMSNRTKLNAPHQETGTSSFILEDTSLSKKSCIESAQAKLRSIKTETLPPELAHLRITSIYVKPLSISRIASRLEAKRQAESAFDVFISYSSSDERAATKVRQALESEGLRCFLASKEIKSGEVFSESIRQALIEASELCFLFSPNSKNSEWVITEWGAAWALEKDIVPIFYRTGPADLPERLRGLQGRDIDELDDYVADVVRRQERRKIANG
ncbi:MAG: toll/interleukin-1 receptor domain-containing protein, partial [Chloroflexi bacterium]|nr:toll/interleukin-1 receptor domain-containing protein [Chloroflexota bacterium]